LDANGPKVHIADRLVPWWAAPNLFRTAKSRSISTAVVGWMHPYCDTLRELLAECFCYAVPDNVPGQPRLWEEYADKHGLFRTVLKQARYDTRIFETLVRPAHSRVDDDLIQISREIHRNGYLAASAAALRVAANPRLDLILLHLPVPHPYGIYDRVAQRVSTATPGGYIDNLLLADRTLAMIRSSMEAGGLWERSAVLVSSDHYLREDLWGTTPFWDAEVRRVTSETKARFVPYLLKLPFQQQHSEFPAEFSTIVTRDLVEALMVGQLTSPEAVAQWLASRAGATSQSARLSPPHRSRALTRPGS
jgi:hypothetical protein